MDRLVEVRQMLADRQDEMAELKKAIQVVAAEAACLVVEKTELEDKIGATLCYGG
jgi:regulator of replication initiation timing